MISITMADSKRACFDESVTRDDILELAQDSRVKVLQCANPVPDSVWQMLDECFFKARSDVLLRVYAHYSTVCDLSLARHMTQVRHFAADCLMQATNVEAIAEMPSLESLDLGIYSLKDFRVLESVPAALRELSLGATESKKPSLGPISRLRSLRKLHIEGHHKAIEVLGELAELEDLTLRSITTPDLRYLGNLSNLWSLDIKLGGIKSFAGIEGKKSIRYLELWQVRDVQNVDIVAELPGMQNLFLQSLPHITAMPDLKSSTDLRRVVIQNVKSMSDFNAFETVPALDDFALLQGMAQTPEQLLPILKNPAVKRVCGSFGADRKNDEFSLLRESHGKSDWSPHEPFQYRMV